MEANKAGRGEKKGARASSLSQAVSARPKCPKCGSRGHRRRVNVGGVKRRMWTCRRCQG